MTKDEWLQAASRLFEEAPREFSVSLTLDEAMKVIQAAPCDDDGPVEDYSGIFVEAQAQAQAQDASQFIMIRVG